MAKGKNTNRKANVSNGTNLGFEAQLWAAADKMRSHMDPAEYKHVVLGLIFLKYISDSFQERYEALQNQPYANPEDRDEYLMDNLFWVPKEARFSNLQANAKQPDIGKRVDDAMITIERENPQLKGILKKDYAASSLDKQRLGELIDLISNVGFRDDASRSKDVLGRVYEYFLGRFASAEGKGGGEFYTPRSVVNLLVEMIEPYRGRVYDPCFGSGGMFVMSEKFAEAHGGNKDDIAIFGQESNPTTWKLCQMNLAIRGLSGNLGSHHADSFHNDLHKDLKADYILANPPFNVSDWGGEQLTEDVRWQYGVPPKGNANYGWIQHIVHHLSPTGIAGFVLANGSLATNTSGEGMIRRKLIEADLVDCIVALPPQLFYSVQIPVSLWFLARDKNSGFRDRRGETLFMDARKMGHMTDRTHRDLSDEDIERMTRAYHAWRGEPAAGKYEDLLGFCKGATLEEIASYSYVLTPGRYVGSEVLVDDGEPFEEKLMRLAVTLEEQFAESARLEEEIRNNLRVLGYGN